ncbi:MAG: MerR family transcriptional regulator [Candidatus Schekmanbacteria bacterium]|nr:MerR family transcriptional regulator [Candidatus Schekmanbacteria bacterium]
MIGVAAKMLDVHPQTLRLYERQGLVQPSRSVGNTRLYSRDDIDQARLVLRLTRDLGVNLAGAEIILNLRNQLCRTQRTLEEVVDIIMQEAPEAVEKIQAHYQKHVSETGTSEILSVRFERSEPEEDE